MAKLPDPNQMTRPALAGAAPVQSLQGGIVESAQARAAQAQGEAGFAMGRAFAGLGQDVAALALKEQQRLTQLTVDKEASDLREFSTDALAGEQGALRAEQGEVLKPDYLKKHTDKFDAEHKRRRDLLPTDRHREEFDARTRELRSGYLRSIFNHQMAETDKYEETVYQSAKASYINAAQTLWADPEAIHANVEGMRALTINRLAQKGITDPEAMDPVVREQVGSVHASIVDAARRAGSMQYANEYFATARELMTPAQIADVEGRLKPATSFATGQAVGEEAVQLLNAGGGFTEALKLIVEKTGGDKDAAAAAKAYVNDFEKAKQTDQADVIGSGYLTFLNSGMNAEALVAVMQDDRVLALPPAERAKMTEHMLGLMSGEIRGKRSDQLALWNGEEANVIFGQWMTRDDLASIPETQIYKLQDTIGPPKVQKIIMERRGRLAGQTRFNIDADILREATPPALFKASNKGKLAAFRGLVESNLADWKAMNPGKLPTLADQKRLARSALTEYNAPGLLWGSNPTPLYEAPEEERERLRLEALRPEWEQSMRAQALRRGRTLTTEELEAGWAKKIGGL